MSSPGQAIADACRTAAREARSHGIPFTWEDVAPIADRIIETMFARKAARRERRASFVPPTPDQVTAYAKEIGYPMDGASWCDHYELKGWKTSGSTKMCDWKAACRKWKANGWQPRATGMKSQQRESVSLGALQMELKKLEQEIYQITNPGGSPWGAPISEADKTKLAQLRDRKAALEQRCREMTA